MKLSLLLIYEHLPSEHCHLHVKKLPGRKCCGTRYLDLHRAKSLGEDRYSDFKEDYGKYLEPHSRAVEELIHREYLYLDRECILTSCSPEQLKGMTVVTADPAADFADYDGIFVDDPELLPAVCMSIMEVFEIFQQWSLQVRDDLIQGEPMQKIFDSCAMVTPDTVYITDTSMKMICTSVPSLMSEISATWRYQTAYGYMPVNIMHQLIVSGELERINRHHHSFTHETETFNVPYSCYNIFVDEVLRAHIFVVAIYSSPSQTHKEIAEELGRLLLPYVSVDPAFHTGGGKEYEGLFQDILHERIQYDDLIQQQISIFDWRSRDAYAVLTIDASTQNSGQRQHIIQQLDHRQNAYKAFSDGKDIICLYHGEDDGDKLRFAAKMEVFLKEMHLKGAFSKTFRGIKNMNAYYKATKQILDYCKEGENGRSLYFQENYGLVSILNAALEKHDAFELCHPDVLKLYIYDREHETEYLETLFQYLLQDRNAVQTAKKLFIHRNTMNYRLEKLREMISLEEEDDMSRLYILASITLIKKQTEETIL